MTTIKYTKNEKSPTITSPSQNTIQQNVLKIATKENSTNETNILRSFSLKDLAVRLGTSEDMVRIFLLKNYPGSHVKNKSWTISPDFTRQIEMDYKNQVNAREAKKRLRIEKELSGYI
jgi:hypothetical protein